MKRLMGAAIVAIMLAGPLAGLSIADCDAKLVGTAWDCNFSCSTINYGTRCVEFGYYGLSSDFDMYVSGFVGDEGCICAPKGTKASPNFDASQKVFQCTEVNFPSSFQGKVVSSKKMTGQYWDHFGASCLAVCKKRLVGCP